MKKCLALLLAANIVFLAGCSTAPRANKWEYKVARLPRGGDANRPESPETVRESQETLLNELGKEGWVLISQTDGRLFYFKRPVR